LNNGDNGQRDGSSVLDPHDQNREWGRAAHDATHVFSSNFTYPLPFQFSSGVANALLGGWEVSGLSLIMSGQPLTPQLQFDYGRTGNAGAGDRPDLTPGYSLNPVLGTPDHWYDPKAFTWPNPLGLKTQEGRNWPQLGFLGNVGRNTIIGPRIVSFDITAMKSFRFTETKSLQFRAEFFNVLNHANMGQPGVTPLLSDDVSGDLRCISRAATATRAASACYDSSLPEGAVNPIIRHNPAGGSIQLTSTKNREIQFGLKFIF
jgi:hypothetical protein